MSPTTKPILNFVVDPDLLRRLNAYRFANHFESRAAAVKFLLEWALPQNPQPKADT